MNTTYFWSAMVSQYMTSTQYAAFMSMVDAGDLRFSGHPLAPAKLALGDPATSNPLQYFGAFDPHQHKEDTE